MIVKSTELVLRYMSNVRKIKKIINIKKRVYPANWGVKLIQSQNYYYQRKDKSDCGFPPGGEPLFDP